MRKALLPVALLFSAAIGGWAVAQSASSAPPPVNTVNGQKGDVVVPTVQRQVSTAIDASVGLVSWTFPTPFTNQPTCWETLAATNTSYSFDVPIVTAISLTSVTVKLSAHPSSLSITSLGLPIGLPLTVAPPAGTTVTLSCVGALP